MTTLLSRAFAALRVCFGLNDPSENHLHPSHGWLLPPSAERRPLALAPAAPVRLPPARVR
jgi:hypothetical protein